MAGIKPYVKELLEEYSMYRGRDHRSPDFKPFWDAVVITTTDADQRAAFIQQIEDKRDRGELPRGLPVHVVADPPGSRIGNGGSTLTVLEHLASFYGNDLDLVCSMKIFLIHAGGWSQRLPSTTVLGKIFSVIPYGCPPFQMLDLKLALYWPFVERISPGIFLVCADDFSVHNLARGDNLGDEKWRIPSDGFTALAHPSPVDLGRAHGVYVVDGVGGWRDSSKDGNDEEGEDGEKNGCGERNGEIEEGEEAEEEGGGRVDNEQKAKGVDFTQLVVIRKCLKVLQKPSYERMRSNGAIFRVLSNDSVTSRAFSGCCDVSADMNVFGDGVKVKGDVVYTDSCFYIGTDVVRKLFRLKEDLGDLDCEIDAYGDFLQAVGTKATVDYVHDISNVSQVSAGLVDTRTQVFNALNGSDIHVVLLNSSAYMHIGTIKELLWHMCRDKEFRDRLSLGKYVFNLWSGINGDGKRREIEFFSGVDGIIHNSGDVGDARGESCEDSDGQNKKGSEVGNRGISQSFHADGDDRNVCDSVKESRSICDKNVSDNTCIIHSCINDESYIGDDSYVEFCDFEMALRIVGNSVVSNCKISCEDGDGMAAISAGNMCEWDVYGDGNGGGGGGSCSAGTCSAGRSSCCCCSSSSSSSSVGGVTKSNKDGVCASSIGFNCALTIPENTFIHTVPIFVSSFQNLTNKGLTHAAATCNDNDNDSCKNEFLKAETDDVSPINDDSRTTRDTISPDSVNNYTNKYVTIVLDIKDDLKKSVSITDLGSLPFNGSSIDHYLSQRCITMDDIISPAYLVSQRDTTNEQRFDTTLPSNSDPDDVKTSLWELKLFPAFPTMTSSFLEAIRVRQGHRVKVADTKDDSREYFSLSEIRTMKDVTTMLGFRRNLYNKIKHTQVVVDS